MEKISNELLLKEKWDKATIANNFIFYKVMRNNPEVCKELLEILLEIKIDHIDIKQEEEIEIDYGKKGVRLDVYAVGKDKAYNLEMQVTDTGELPERSRYYASAIDIDQLNSGASYKELCDSYIIFICITDIFNKGLAKYSFENICHEDNSIKLNDRTYKYFFIANNYDKILNVKQRSFLELIINNKCTSPFAEKIAYLVEDAKHNTQWRKQFMDLEREKSFAYEFGRKDKGIEDVRNFYANGASVELIAKSMNMTVEQVTEIVKDVVVAQA